MQPYTLSQRARLLPSRSAAAAVLSAAALLGAAAPSALAQSDGWEHYSVATPKTITLEFDSDLLAFDLCWSDHTEMTKERIVNAAIAQMTSPGQLHVIDMPGLPPFYRRTSNASVWRDLNGDVIRSSDILPNRRNYHIDVEQALIDIAGRIRDARPGAKLTFKGFELQPLPGGRPPAYEQLGAVQDFYITDRTIYLNHVGGLLDHALNSTFFRARVNFASEQENWLVFPDQNGQFSLASMTTPDWPPAEFEPEILALWGGGGDDSGGGGEALQVDESVILVPGSGFPAGWGENVQPIGSPAMSGYDAKAIARWNVVPFQTIEDEPFSVGIVAFHINEIDRIEFFLEGGPGVTVTEMTHNPRTDTWEYWAVLDPDVFLAMNHPDGPIELRAIAYPKDAGEPRVLEPLMLNTNAGQTLPKPVMWCAPWGSDETGDGSQENPFRQPYRALQSITQSTGTSDGAVVYLMAGEYSWGNAAHPNPLTTNRWSVVRSAPGIDRDDVRFTSSNAGGFKTRLLSVQGVTLDAVQVSTAGGGDRKVWMNDIVSTGPGRLSGQRPYMAQNWNDVYITSAVFRDWRDAVMGAELARGVSVHNISSDAFTNSMMVINSSVDGIDASGTSDHPDVYQFSGTGLRSNVIVYGMRAENADSQGLFSDNLDQINDVAFVNVMIAKPLDQEPNDPMFSQFMVSANHLLLINVSLPNSRFIWRAPHMTNVLVEGCLFYAMAQGPTKSGGVSDFDEAWFRNNHFVDAYTFGTMYAGVGFSLGNPHFVNAESGNFEPLPNSPLRLRLSDSSVPVDINGQERSVPDTIGAIR